MSRPLTFVLALALLAGAAMAEEVEFPSPGSLTGQVKGTSTPLSFSKVYIYHLSDQSLSKVVTDAEGNFRFDSLPAGLYKVIAFKDGFVPAIALITRSKREAQQYLNLSWRPTDLRTRSVKRVSGRCARRFPRTSSATSKSKRGPGKPW